MTYDTSRHRVLLYGGADATRVVGETWEWDGRAWTRVADDGPGARTFPAFAYDEMRHEAVLFGGNRVLFGKPDEFDTVLGDTWLWRDRRWRQLDVKGPPARAEAGVAYDRHRGRIVMFGGNRRTAAGNVRLGDTWEWDGARWIEVTSAGPAARNGSALAYDEKRRRVILFGGSGRASDTWEWDGIQWVLREAGTVPGRYNAAMTYLTSSREILRFGGWTGTERAGDTWALGAGEWLRIDVEGPLARNHSALVYDSRRRRAVLFGGHDGDRVFGDTWEWDGKRWRALASVAAEKRTENGH